MYTNQILSLSLFLNILPYTNAMQYASKSDIRDFVKRHEVPQMARDATYATKVTIENLQKENAALQAMIHLLTEKNSDLEKRLIAVESLVAPTKLLIQREALVQEMARRWMLPQEFIQQQGLPFEEAQIESEKEL